MGLLAWVIVLSTNGLAYDKAQIDACNAMAPGQMNSATFYTCCCAKCDCSRPECATPCGSGRDSFDQVQKSEQTRDSNRLRDRAPELSKGPPYN